MKYPYLYYFILAILFAIPHQGHTNEKQLVITSDMQYEYAQTLFVEKDYDTALIEFKRFAHFFPDSEQVDQVQFSIAVCLFNQKKYHDAARAFNELIINGANDDIVKEAYFYQSKSFMNLGNSGYAQIVMQNYLKLVEDEDQETRDRIYFNIFQIHLADAEKFKKDALVHARESLSKISKAGEEKYAVDKYVEQINRAITVPLKNPTAAGVFALIPGGGFLYCERYQDALVTFLLNAGLMIAAYEAYDNNNKALAGVIGFVESGFYTANIYGAISSAHKYNRAQILKILNREVSIAPWVDPAQKSYGLSLNYSF